MRKTYQILLLFSLFVAPLQAAIGEHRKEGQFNPCRRIVSMAPSITGILKAFHLVDNIVGVSRYDREELSKRGAKDIGGYLDPNYEAILSLNPSVVLLVKEQRNTAQKLRSLGLKTALVEHREIKGILISVKKIGEICGMHQRAERIAKRLSTELKRLRARYTRFGTKRVLVVIGGKTPNFSGAYLAGVDTYYTSLLKAVNGENVVSTKTIPLSGVSLETLISLKPDVVLFIAPEDMGYRALARYKSNLLTEWTAIKTASPLRDARIYLLTGKEAYIPSLDFVFLAKKIGRLIHRKTR
ncbi:MAG: hypothetical protein D6808_04605 [Candidatus Dadabacteria bacterium]|nr:MAG: hypothetical protein D6808_04605 [Candidatus Dadabacteria bacterium]